MRRNWPSERFNIRRILRRWILWPGKARVQRLIDVFAETSLIVRFDKRFPHTPKLAV